MSDPPSRLEDMTEPSIFTRIRKGDVPGEVLASTDTLFAIRDIAPQAPVHILVIPKSEAYRDVTELAAGDPGLLAELVAFAQRLADEHADGHYRLVFNTGANAGQTVPHVHGHLLAGGLSEKSVGA